MNATRAEKPQWFALVDKVKAIREIDMGKSVELAAYLGIREQRVTEYLTFIREPGAETTIQIQRWIEAKEQKIIKAGLSRKYNAAVKAASAR